MEKKDHKALEKEDIISNSEESKKASNKTSDKANTGAKKKPGTTRKKSSASSQLKKQLEESNTKLVELHDRYLRLTAEYDNYRKRTLKEKMELIKTGGEQVLINILPVIDNLERARNSVADAKDIEAVKEGIDLIFAKFIEYLRQNGIKEIPATGEAFDTDKHEAITKIPAPDKKAKGKVVDVIEKGYYLHDKVIRYAKVVVGE